MVVWYLQRKSAGQGLVSPAKVSLRYVLAVAVINMEDAVQAVQGFWQYDVLAA
jgi:hypothetical protein